MTKSQRTHRVTDEKIDVLIAQTKLNIEVVEQLRVAVKEMTEQTTKLTIQLNPETMFQGFVAQIKQYVGGAVLGLFGSIGLVLLLIGAFLMWVAQKLGFIHF